MKLVELLGVNGPLPLAELSKGQLKELQQALNLLGFPVGAIDGLIGPRTRNAWAEFKTDIFIGNPGLIGTESIARLQQQLDAVQTSTAADFSTREGTIEAISAQCRDHGIGLDTQIAYVLATTQWETNQTFQPVREAYWLSEAWRKKNLRYYPYYGRGYVQLTWKNNYEKYSHMLGVDLVGDPDKAMKPGIALFVLVHGFKTGAFTGRKISDYINSHQADFIGARRCINGTDKAHAIADLAKSFLAGM